ARKVPVALEDIAMRIRWRRFAILFAVGVVLTPPSLSRSLVDSSHRRNAAQRHSARPSRGRTRAPGNRVPQLTAIQVGLIAPPNLPSLRSVRTTWFVGGLPSARQRAPWLITRILPDRIPLRC